MPVRVRIATNAGPERRGELSALTFAFDVTTRMEAYPKICDYGSLREAVNKHYDGDEDATQFLCALLHSFHKNFLIIILNFLDLPPFTTLGTIGEPRELCQEARLLNVVFTVALRKFIAPSSPKGLLCTRTSRQRRAHMFLTEKCFEMPYRFPPEWGIHTLTESDHGDRNRALSDYLWTMVGGLQDPIFGDSETDREVANMDAKLGQMLHSFAKGLLAIPDAEWESWTRTHVFQ